MVTRSSAVPPALPVPLRTARAVPHNLPARFSSFVGRAAEIAALGTLLAETRLLTLAGAGGAGKTRLALQVASTVLSSFPDGIWFVDLAPVTDPAAVVQSVVLTLRLPDEPGRATVETLLDTLHARAVLLVLDNCEQVVAACAALAERLLSACPRLRILATSREVLNVAGELIWTVPPLTMPATADEAAPGDLARYEAIQLFCERARAVQTDFRQTAENGPLIARICQRLDGMPLAIELAAARVRVLSVAQIAARLDAAFLLLTGGSRTALPRQQTLGATMDWSYALLTDGERRLLHRLAVFVGGWTLEAAEAVGDDAAEAAATLDLLAHLVNKSLIVADESTSGRGDARYRLLETIRQYSLTRLEESGEADIIRDRHARFYLAFAESREPHFYNADQAATLAQVEREHGNIRAALTWLLARGQAEAAVRLASGIRAFWLVRDHLRDGRGWLEAVLRQADRLPPALRAKALNSVATFAFRQGDYPSARAYHEESLELCRTLDDPHLTAQALMRIGYLAVIEGDAARASALFAEGLALARAADDCRTVAQALNFSGIVARQRGEDDRAATCFEESLRCWRALGEQEGLAMVLHNFGPVVHRLGDTPRALAILAESLALSRALLNKHGVAICLAGLAGVIGAHGGAAHAARLLGAAHALRTSIGVQWDPPDSTEFSRSLSLVRSRLGESAFVAAWNDGATLSFEQAIALAESLLPASAGGPDEKPAFALLAATPPSAGPPPMHGLPIRPEPSEHSGLTRREIEILRLIAVGRSNQEIAAQLAISEHTVHRHVANMLTKLGLSSRAAAVAAAARHGLL